EHACIISKTGDDFTLKQSLLIWSGTVAFEFNADEIAQPAQFCNRRQLAEFRVQILGVGADVIEQALVVDDINRRVKRRASNRAAAKGCAEIADLDLTGDL